MAKASATKLLFQLKSPLRAKVYRGRFEPFASTRFIDVGALKKVRRAVLECGTLEIGGRGVTLVAETRKGVITEIRPAECKGCSPTRRRKPAPKSQIRNLITLVDQKLSDRKVKVPKWPVGKVLSRRSLGFSIPIGPIIIIIGTDPDEGIDSFDFCIVINSGSGSCIYCLFAPNACVGL